MFGLVKSLASFHDKGQAMEARTGKPRGVCRGEGGRKETLFQ